jgi:hypothetical protein
MTTSRQFAVVSEAEAKVVPYPYVYVDADGSLRELHSSERAYLQEPFLVFDGARPYVKTNYRSVDGGGSKQGFCLRSLVPKNLPVAAAPTEDPYDPSNRVDFITALKSHAETKGFRFKEMPVGRVIAKRGRKQIRGPIAVAIYVSLIAIIPLIEEWLRHTYLH